MADLLNQTFKTCFTREDTRNVPEPKNLNPRTNLDRVDFCERNVRKKIKNLKPESAAGPTELAQEYCRNWLTDSLALTSIFIKSMEEGVVPPD
jgi:hypothetical protein